MSNSESVALRTTKDVVCKAANLKRRDAYRRLSSPVAPETSTWTGVLTQDPSLRQPTPRLGDVAAKYDGLMRALDYDSYELTDEEDLLAALLVIREIKKKFDVDEARIIAAARRKKVTWQRLADAMELRSRSSAERRYLQLNEISDSDVRPARTQAERVEQARIQRSRRAERAWAATHGDRVTFLARSLSLPVRGRLRGWGYPAGVMRRMESSL
ncbi:hypothetical protein [Streptomyces sp. NPDC046161]|uniref:hypothetical protein n=1 Tax=Streptomyces sp. NPDC046161 TaxID=3155132 RepID=UPI0033CD8218